MGPSCTVLYPLVKKWRGEDGSRQRLVVELPAPHPPGRLLGELTTSFCEPSRSPPLGHGSVLHYSNATDGVGCLVWTGPWAPPPAPLGRTPPLLVLYEFHDSRSLVASHAVARRRQVGLDRSQLKHIMITAVTTSVGPPVLVVASLHCSHATIMHHQCSLVNSQV